MPVGEPARIPGRMERQFVRSVREQPFEQVAERLAVEEEIDFVAAEDRFPTEGLASSNL